MVALVVAWCIWTARDQTHFWWFQPDPEQVEHEADHHDETDNPQLELPAVKRSLAQYLRNFISLPCESHAMQDIASPYDVRDQRNRIPGPNFWANTTYTT